MFRFLWHRYFFSLLFIFFFYEGRAQDINFNCKWVISSANRVLLDSITVETGSVIVLGHQLKYQLQFNILVFDENQLVPDSLFVCYRRISKVIFDPIKQRSLSQYETVGNQNYLPQIKENESFTKSSIIDTPGLYKTGTISRAITVGNQQNLFVNSTLNLQMEGKLTDDLNLRAVITDQNIPYQPDGNTQQIRDFDRVLIELQNNKLNVTGGDIVLSSIQDQNYFLKYYKNQQGFQITYQDQIGKFNSKTKASIAGAKGKFASISIEPLEGIQGPYRLRGIQNEKFIIVLANTERVFIDGKLMNRGFDNDYIIDYNLGEITFNPKVLINRFTRIRVDFEYTQQNYLRSIQFFSEQISNDKLFFSVDYYRERDNERQPLAFEFLQSKVQTLQLVGDNAKESFISGVDSLGFSAQQIRYARREISIDNQIIEYFEYSIEPLEALYSLSFSNVGNGNGNYRRISGSQNGTIYEWLAPINNVKQGDYEPIIEVILPNSKQMLVTRADINLSPFIKVIQEVAASDQDQNLYSDLNDSDNQGWASITHLVLKDKPVFEFSKFSAVGSLEYNNRNFRPIDRFRYIEFDRDWNYLNPFDSIPQDELIVSASAELTKNIENFVSYRADLRKRGDALNGTQQTLKLAKRVGSLYYLGNHFLLSSEQQFNQAKWMRSYSELGFDLQKSNIAYFFEIDQNVVRNQNREINFSAMHFQQQGILLQHGDSSEYKWMSKVSFREDQLPVLGVLEDYTSAWQIEQQFATPSHHSQQFSFTGIYRTVAESIASNQEDQSLQGQLVANNRIGKNLIKSRLNYTIQNARELQRNFVYTLVGAGQGTHTWRDENGDGVTDLNEFYEAINSDERNYAKFFIPTDQYINAYQMRYMQTIDASFPSSWRNATGWQSLLSRFSTNLNLNLQHKTIADSWLQRVTPYASISEENLISQQNFARYSLFYNRSTGKVGLSTAWQSRANKQLNQNGFELTAIDQWENTVRWTISKFYLLNLNFQNGVRLQESDFLLSRNFRIHQSSIKTEFSWQPSINFRVASCYLIQQKQNTLTELTAENSLMHDLGFMGYWTRKSLGVASLGLNLINFNFRGDPNSYLGYILLDGLQPGNNARVNLNWQQSLKNGLQLTIQYFGRKSESSPLIHSGTMQLTAFF